MPILFFLGISVLELGLMYATDVRRQTDKRQTDVRQKHRLMPAPCGGGGIIITKHTLHVCNNEQMRSLIHKIPYC